MFASYLIGVHLTATAILIAIASPIPSTLATPGLIDTINIAGDESGSIGVSGGDPVRTEPIAPTQDSDDGYLHDSPCSLSGTAITCLTDESMLVGRDTGHKRGRAIKLEGAERTVLFPEWIRNILLLYNIPQTTMELPQPSDRNGCKLLEKWLQALHNYIDVVVNYDLKKRDTMQKRLDRFRRELRHQFGFTAKSFAKRKKLDRTEIKRSELIPPFLPSPLAQEVSPSFLTDFNFNSEPRQPPGQKIENVPQIPPTIAAFQPEIHQQPE
ncbi:hypothetical protein H0H93_015841, partial [Arthromyces matolae]